MAKLSVVVPSNEVEVGGVKYRKVERKAQAGDIVKITDDGAPSYVVEGAFYEVKRIDSCGDPRIADEDGDDFDLCDTDFDVYEKVMEPAAVEYREVNRKAEKGERILIVNACDYRYSNGDVLVVEESKPSDVMVYVKHPEGTRNGCAGVLKSEYVVLEPVNCGEPAPQPERLKVGEYAKVVGSSHRSFFGGKDGDIVSIVRESDRRYKCERIDGHDYGGNPWADPESLVRATESEVEAAKKAAERAKNIGEFADGGYAEIVNANRENSTTTPQRNNGTYVKVTSARTGADHPLKVTLPNGEYGICNADALRKVTREEYEEATKPKPAFNVGDYAKVIADNFEHRVGHIVQITGDEPSYSEFDFAVKRITYGGNGYIAAKNIEKISAEEVARIEEETKWSAIGRKVNEFKRGDIIEATRRLGEQERIYGEYTGERDEVALGVRDASRKYRSVSAHSAKLLIPVEQRFDLSEGGASTSK